MFLPSGAAHFSSPISFQFNREYGLLPNLPVGIPDHPSSGVYSTPRHSNSPVELQLISTPGLAGTHVTKNGPVLSKYTDNGLVRESRPSVKEMGLPRGISKRIDSAAPVKLACTECRLRHLKCDARAPCCGRCVLEGLDCCYIKSRRGYKGSRKDKDLLKLQLQQRQDDMKAQMAERVGGTQRPNGHQPPPASPVDHTMSATQPGFATDTVSGPRSENITTTG